MSLKSQDDFIKREWSIRLDCPSCKGRHSVMELIGGEQRFDDYKTKALGDLRCPETNKVINHHIGFFAGQQWFTEKG